MSTIVCFCKYQVNKMGSNAFSLKIFQTRHYYDKEQSCGKQTSQVTTAIIHLVASIRRFGEYS